jgi:mannose-6-phosphate isomerase-like protein (cupin superfamily)
MLTIDRRTLLCALGAGSLAPAAHAAPAGGAGQAAIARPGESRFHYASAQQAKRSPCKLTSEDSRGAMSIFELYVPSRSGPVRHVHHREDEWCYVAAGEFVFEVGSEKFSLPVGGSVLMPRGVPHVWANTATGDGRLIVTCAPGGFEKFFDALGRIPDGEVNDKRIMAVMSAYGMDYVGPALFGIWRQK